MSILLNKNSRLLIQGVTGNEGSFHTRQMINYGSNVVGGVSPGRGGDWIMDGKIPVFDTARVAVEATGANVSVIFVPARFAPDAILEAADAGISLIVCITEGIPTQDMMRVMPFINQKNARLIGPNCPGLITPGETKAGIIPNNIALAGPIGVVSRSGTLTYEVIYTVSKRGLGCSTCLGIGGDPVIGTGFVEILDMFEADGRTEQVILIGEIGGNEEQKAADFIGQHMTKPVIAYIAGQAAPPGKRMGHAGAIIEGGEGLAEKKIEALLSAGARIAHHPEEIPDLLAR